MLRRRALKTTAASGVLLLTTVLAACGGSDDTAEETPDGSGGSGGSSGEVVGEIEGVTFSGEVGDGVEAEWSAPVETPAETTVTTLVEGDGGAIEDGDTVNTYLWVGNGTDEEQLFTDYDNGAPQAVPNNPDQLDEVFQALLEGQTYGSRVVAVTSGSTLFGAEPNQLGVEPEDAVVVVADLVEEQPTSPTPTSDEPEDASPESQPSVVEEGGVPTGLDFEGIEEPELDQPVQRVVLEEGDGPVVKATDTLTINYLGSTYDADAPFDESYSRGEPIVSPLAGLIPGWSIGLTGVPVGSRVLLQIPPAFGYDAQGSGENIPGNSTLWFLIDIEDASAG